MAARLHATAMTARFAQVAVAALKAGVASGHLTSVEGAEKPGCGVWRMEDAERCYKRPTTPLKQGCPIGPVSRAGCCSCARDASIGQSNETNVFAPYAVHMQYIPKSQRFRVHPCKIRKDPPQLASCREATGLRVRYLPAVLPNAGAAHRCKGHQMANVLGKVGRDIGSPPSVLRFQALRPLFGRDWTATARNGPLSVADNKCRRRRSCSCSCSTVQHPLAVLVSGVRRPLVPHQVAQAQGKAQ